MDDIETTRQSPLPGERTIEGPLFAREDGPLAAPAVVFLHPNPMDSSCWLYQMAHFSTWYRCIAVDLPGYGRSPRAGVGLTMEEIAAACWDAVDQSSHSDKVALVGCSVGSRVAQWMYHLRPDPCQAIVLSGTGWTPVKTFAQHRIDAYREHGVEYRHDYSLELQSPRFSATPLARWFAQMFAERNGAADLETIIRMMEALAAPDPEWLHADLSIPTLIVTGTEDVAHKSAFALQDRIPNSEMEIIDGVGHTSNIEAPHEFDRAVLNFFRRFGHA